MWVKIISHHIALDNCCYYDTLRMKPESGMLTLELASCVLKIPIDGYTTLSPNLIGCSALSQEYCKLIGWYWKIMRRQLWILPGPIKPLWDDLHVPQPSLTPDIQFRKNWQLQNTLHREQVCKMATNHNSNSYSSATPWDKNELRPIKWVRVK